MEIFWLLLFQLLLIGLNAVFACAEIAVLSVSETKLERMAEEGNRRAKRLHRLTRQPARFRATIQVAITLSGFLGSAFAADNFSDRIVNWIYNDLGWQAWPQSVLNAISVVLITLILSYVTLIFGELVPKRVAMRKAEAVALGLSGTVTFISRLFAPIVWLLTVSTNGVLRLLGIDPNQNEEEVSEEEIRMMVDAGSRQGAIDKEENEFIQNVFEFDDLTAGEIATHRTEVVMLWMEEDMDVWRHTIHDTIHAMYPVCDGTVDNIVGILNSKAYFRMENPDDRDAVMAEAVRPAYFVPDGVKADLLFRNMKKTHNKFAVVLDEYGGVSGVVTINDLIERLVGDLPEPEEAVVEEEPMIEELPDGVWKIRGNAPLDEVEERLKVTLPESEDNDTFGGLALAALGSIPEDGQRFDVTTEQLEIRDAEVRDHQVERAYVTVIAPPPDEEDEADADADEGEKEE